MMKKVITAALMISLLATVTCFGEAVTEEAIGEEETELVLGMVNPFSDFDELLPAEELAGYSIKLPQIDGYEIADYRAIPYGMLEVIYNGENGDDLRIRKAPGESDISGDYNEYADIYTIEGENFTAEVRADDNGVGNAVWTNGAFAYAITSDQGLDRDMAAALIKETAESNQALPAFTCPSEDPYELAIVDFLKAEANAAFTPSDVMIPVVCILAVNDEDPEQIHIWGTTLIENYRVEDSKMVNVSGGEFPGMFTLEPDEDGNLSVVDYEEALTEGEGDGSLSQVYMSAGEELGRDLLAAYSAIHDDSEGDSILNQMLLAQINEYLNQAGLNVDTAEHEDTGEMEIAEAETLDLSEEGVEEITEDALEEIDLLEDLEPTSEEPQA